MVDDSPVTRSVIVHSAESLGYGCVEAANGEEALRALEREPEVRMVVSDELMPKMDGYELLQRLRGSDNLVPFLMVTALSEREFLTRAMSAGATDFMVKPIQRAELRRKMARVLGIEPPAA